VLPLEADGAALGADCAALELTVLLWKLKVQLLELTVLLWKLKVQTLGAEASGGSLRTIRSRFAESR